MTAFDDSNLYANDISCGYKFTVVLASPLNKGKNLQNYYDKIREGSMELILKIDRMKE